MNNLPASNQSEPKNEIVVYQPELQTSLNQRTKSSSTSRTKLSGWTYDWKKIQFGLLRTR